MVTLLCTVRGCALPLETGDRRLVCANRHSFDVARSGYVNLLQPQDRRSKNPGDSAEAVAARRRFLDAGHARPLLEAVASRLERGPILDAGCGEGHHLGAFPFDGYGVDISVPAIDAAARRYPDRHWVVANADRFLPYADRSFGTIVSITARINALEFRRLLAAEGTLLVAVAGDDDLIELREAVQGERKLIDRTASAIAALSDSFTVVHQARASHTARLDAGAIQDVMTSSYRGMRSRERERLESLSELDVTLSRDLLMFRARS